MSNHLTAMDIENQEFRRKLNGYDSEEVTLFMRTVAEEVERLTLQNDELQMVCSRLREQVDEFRTREQLLQETLVTAQRMAEDVKGQAKAEADLMVKQARLQSERALQESQDQLARLESEIARCKLEKDLFQKRLRCTIEEHMALLEQRREQDVEEPSAPGNVHPLQRRAGSFEASFAARELTLLHVLGTVSE